MWLDINLDNIKHIYQVNEYGEVKNKNTNKILKQKITKFGYCEVSLMCSNNKMKSCRVHRLVLLTFPYVRYKDQIEVNHLDCNKTNNKLNNLKWCTPEENKEHARQNGLLSYKGENNPMSTNKNIKIEKICELLEKGNSTEGILIYLGLSIDSRNIKLINRIRSRDSWRFISSKYKWNMRKKGGNNMKNKKYVDSVKSMLKSGMTTGEIMIGNGWDHYLGKEKYNKLEFIGRLRRLETFTDNIVH